MKNIFVTLLIIVAISCASSQSKSQTYPNLNEDPNHPCSQPGANCKIESKVIQKNSEKEPEVKIVKKTRVCDDNGCIETIISSDATYLTRNLLLLSFATFYGVVRNIFQT